MIKWYKFLPYQRGKHDRSKTEPIDQTKVGRLENKKDQSGLVSKSFKLRICKYYF